MTFFQIKHKFPLSIFTYLLLQELEIDKYENISHLFFYNFAQVSNKRLNDGIFLLVLKVKYIYQFFAERDFCVKKSQHDIAHSFD